MEVFEFSPSDGSSGLGGVETVMDEMPGWISDDAEGILTKVKSEMRFGLECIVRSSPANQASMTLLVCRPPTSLLQHFPSEFDNHAKIRDHSLRRVPWLTWANLQAEQEMNVKM